MGSFKYCVGDFPKVSMSQLLTSTPDHTGAAGRGRGAMCGDELRFIIISVTAADPGSDLVLALV